MFNRTMISVLFAICITSASSLPYAFAQKRITVVSKTSCCCNVSISGTYRFFIDPANGDSSGPHTAVFSTSGCTFKTTEPTSTGYQIYGTITGNQVNFSEVVDGEEAEGFVRQISGFARKTSGGAYIIAGVFNDSNGVTGSWTASKAP